MDEATCYPCKGLVFIQEKVKWPEDNFLGLLISRNWHLWETRINRKREQDSTSPTAAGTREGRAPLRPPALSWSQNHLTHGCWPHRVLPEWSQVGDRENGRPRLQLWMRIKEEKEMPTAKDTTMFSSQPALGRWTRLSWTQKPVLVQVANLGTKLVAPALMHYPQNLTSRHRLCVRSHFVSKFFWIPSKQIYVCFS